MTPEELAKYRSEKLARDRKAEEARKAAVLAERDRVLAQNAAAEHALEATIPYLNQVKGAMSPSFTFKPIRDTSNHMVGVELNLDGVNAEIEKDPSGAISASIRGAGGANPFALIRSAGDLTEDNLSRLVKTMIDGGG
jgi:hypothetical protein